MCINFYYLRFKIKFKNFIYIYLIFYVLFVEGGKETDGVQVAILARRDSSHIKYEWLSDPTDQREEGSSVWLSYNSTKHFLETSIDRLLHATQVCFTCH